jgi:hypothetical protein
MALTLTELMVVPGTGNKRMAIWKVTGDGDTTNIAVAKLKMSKVEAAWTVNINAEIHKEVNVGTNDYVDGFVTSIDIGDPAVEDDGIQNAKEHLLIVIGY